MKKHYCLPFLGFLYFSAALAQTPTDSSTGKLSLNQCIKFALQNEPAVKQSSLDEEIAEKDIQIKFADWFPQINIGNTFQHFITKPVAVFPNFTDPSAGPQYIHTGLFNTNTLGLTASQNIYSNSLRLAGSTAKYYRQQALQNTEEARINLVVNVSKAFYDLLLTRQQLAVLNEDIIRLSSNSKDANAQYQSGTNDRIDFEQSQIQLNNSISQRYSASESIKAKFIYLRQLMGYPESKNLDLQYDSLRLSNETAVDTPSRAEPTRRIEYKVLQTVIALQQESYSYYKYDFFPTLSAFGNFNIVNQNDQLNHLFDRNFPNSVVGLNLSIPIFQGNKRIENMRKAALVIKRARLDEVELKNGIATQYSRALSTYKGYLVQYALNAKNVEIAKHVYHIVNLQYQQGIKPYLNLIQAESDLRTSQLNYLNALFELLSSKLDVQQALGTINTQTE